MIDIPIGHRNAIQRQGQGLSDRRFRAEIEELNRTGDCIINVGNGYYRPDPNDPVDVAETELYFGKELKRARAIQCKRLAMKKSFEMMSR
jgi:hypothetical protein